MTPLESLTKNVGQGEVVSPRLYAQGVMDGLKEDGFSIVPTRLLMAWQVPA